MKRNIFSFYAPCIINADKNKKRKSLSKTHFTSITKIQKNECYMKILYEAKKIVNNLKKQLINTSHCKLCNLTKTGQTNYYNSNFFSQAKTYARTTYYNKAKHWNILHGIGNFYDNLLLFENGYILGVPCKSKNYYQFIMGDGYLNWRKYIWSLKVKLITFECEGCYEEEDYYNSSKNLKLLFNYDQKNQIFIKALSNSFFNIDHFNNDVKKHLTDLYSGGGFITHDIIGENLNIKKLKIIEIEGERELHLQKRLPSLTHLSVDTIVDLSNNLCLEYLKIKIWDDWRVFKALPQIIESTKRTKLKLIHLTLSIHIYNKIIKQQLMHLTNIKCEKLKINLIGLSDLDYERRKLHIDYKYLPDIPKIIIETDYFIKLRSIKNKNYYSTPKIITHFDDTDIYVISNVNLKN